MSRRVLAVLVLSPFSLTSPSEAQQAAKIPRVGFVAPQGRSLPLFDAFRQGLAESGYVDGQNILIELIEPRFAEGHYERFPDIFSELVGLKVDVLVVTGAVTARAARKAVSGIPLVFSVVVDPVRDNVVASLERPGENVTGVTCFDPRQATKQLKLLQEIIPGLKRVAVLGDRGVSEALMNASEEQARALGLKPQRLRVAGPDPDLHSAFAAMKQQHADALLVLEEPVLAHRLANTLAFERRCIRSGGVRASSACSTVCLGRAPRRARRIDALGASSYLRDGALGVHAKEVAELAAGDRLPTLFAPSRAAAGGLIDYGTSQTEAIRHMAAYVDKILKGAKPAALPVETVTRYELIVNLKTAREIGVAIPPEVLKRADRVIQ